MNEQYPQQDEPSSETQDLEANIEAQWVTHDQGGAKKVVEKVVNEGIIWNLLQSVFQPMISSVFFCVSASCLYVFLWKIIGLWWFPSFWFFVFLEALYVIVSPLIFTIFEGLLG